MTVDIPNIILHMTEDILTFILNMTVPVPNIIIYDSSYPYHQQQLYLLSTVASCCSTQDHCK